MMIDMHWHQGPQPPIVEEAAQRLKDTWAQEHDQRVALWISPRITIFHDPDWRQVDQYSDCRLLV
jgi:hypothetical protein